MCCLQGYIQTHMGCDPWKMHLLHKFRLFVSVSAKWTFCMLTCWVQGWVECWVEGSAELWGASITWLPRCTSSGRALRLVEQRLRCSVGFWLAHSSPGQSVLWHKVENSHSFYTLSWVNTRPIHWDTHKHRDTHTLSQPVSISLSLSLSLSACLSVSIFHCSVCPMLVKK